MPNKIPLAVPFIFGSWSQLPSKPSTMSLVTPQPLCPLPPTPAHTPQSAENPRSPTLDSWALGRFAPSCPAPTVCMSGGASPGIVTETPTWPSPECLAAGQGVAGMWGGGCSMGGCGSAWPALARGRGRGLADGSHHVAQSPSVFLSLSCSPASLALRFLALSVCHC